MFHEWHRVRSRFLVKVLRPRRGLILSLFFQFLSLLHGIVDGISLVLSWRIDL